jgi:hypothetical protein
MFWDRPSEELRSSRRSTRPFRMIVALLALNQIGVTGLPH